MKREASVVWEGGLSDGRGVITTPRSALVDAQFFGARSGDAESIHAELIAAALAVCFAMDLTRQLGQAGFTPECVNAAVAFILEKRPTGWTTTMGQLDVLARVRGARQNDFIQAALDAKNHCPILPLLKAPVSMNARFIA